MSGLSRLIQHGAEFGPLLLVAITFNFCVPGTNTGATHRSRPNIVFIFADDWGWGDLSCHGHDWLRTPNIDRLAREGIDFDQFYVLSPVCSPSRVAVMTGLFPARFCINQHFAAPRQNRARNMPDWLTPRAPTLPRFLKQAGYRTAHFGKWHLTNRTVPGAPLPTEYGIDEYAAFNGGAEWPVADVHRTAANTVAFIRANRDRPFYVNVWLHETHTPHAPTPPSLALWKHLDRQKRIYAAVVTDGDKAVGEILAALDELELSGHTIVIFSSDNGPEWTGRNPDRIYHDPDAQVTGYGTYYSVGSTGGLRGRKRSLYEGGIRVPFIVRWPGRAPAGVRNLSTVITGVDLLPTLCAAAGVQLPEEFRGDGENMLAAFYGQKISRRRPVFWYWTGTRAEPDYWPRLAVRDGDWKLLMDGAGDRCELYNIPKDRREQNNVAAQQPELVARLRRMALDWKAGLPKEPDPTCFSPARADD